MRISLIAAMSENRVIGRDGDIPWRIRSDFQHFKRTTLGKAVIAGRKTFESYPKGKALPDRTNIVVTRDENWHAPDAIVTHSISAALEAARYTGVDEVFIGGGAEIYEQAMPYVERMYLSAVQMNVEGGDTFFPTFDEDVWRLTSAEYHPAQEGDSADWYLRIYDRV